jgi:hypothetical protein
MRIAICSITRTLVPYDFHERIENLRDLIEASGHIAVMLKISGCSMLTQARSFIASRAIDEKADVLLWIDDDMIFSARDAFEIALSAYKEKAVIGVMASQRKPLGRTNVRFLSDTKEESVLLFKGGVLLEVLSVGCGLLACHHQILLAMDQELPLIQSPFDSGTMRPYFAEIIEKDSWFGEDVSFCIRARNSGYKIFIDTRVRIGHRGEYDYHIEDTLAAVPRKDSLNLEFK